MSISIKWLRSFDDSGESKYGGRTFNKATYEILKENFGFSFYDLFNNGKEKSYFQFLADIFLSSLRIKGDADIWVRDYFSTVPLLIKKPKYKNVIYIQHIASTSTSKIAGIIFFIYNVIFYRAARKADAIITISNYWKKHFEALGCKNVYTVFPFIDTEKFEIKEKEIEEFKNKYKLNNKPIIYLGNCRSYKGVKESYDSLKNLDVHFVTSGTREVELPCLNLDLDYKEYLCLLKASSIVLFMSKFKEGWGLTAHEAMYLKTPVIGSGLGGNRELLEGGGQIISSFDDLLMNVQKVLENEELANKMREEGYQFAKKFTKKLFNYSWINIIKDINNLS